MKHTKTLLAAIMLGITVTATSFASSWGFTLGNGAGFYYGNGRGNGWNNWGGCGPWGGYNNNVVYYNNVGYYYKNNCNPWTPVQTFYRGANGAAIYQRANGSVWYQNPY